MLPTAYAVGFYAVCNVDRLSVRVVQAWCASKLDTHVLVTDGVHTSKTAQPQRVRHSTVTRVE